MTAVDCPTVMAAAVLDLLDRSEREDKAVEAKYGVHIDGNNDEYLKVLKMAEDSGVLGDVRRNEAIRVLEWALEHAVTNYSTCVRKAIERLKEGGRL
jgi:kynureninase